MMNFVKLSLMALAFGGFAANAQAGAYTTGTTYYVQDAAPSGSYYVSGQTVSMGLTYTTGSGSGTANTVTYTAGTFGVQTSTSQSGPWTGLLTYCLDIDEGLTLKAPGTTTGNTSYKAATVADKIGSGANSLDDFGQTAIAATVNTTVGKLWANVFTYSGFTSASVDVSSAALQIVLWEIFDEAKYGLTSYSLTSGKFKVTTSGMNATQTAVYNLANNILGSLNSWSSSVSVVVLTNATNQDFITGDAPSTTGTPEPAILGLMMLGIAALFAMRRRQPLLARIMR